MSDKAKPASVLFAVLGIAAVFAFVGCGTPMSNDAIIADVKKCKDAGLRADAMVKENGETVKIQCEPYKEERKP